jgi:hypothetical protein
MSTDLEICDIINGMEDICEALSSSIGMPIQGYDKLMIRAFTICTPNTCYIREGKGKMCA